MKASTTLVAVTGMALSLALGSACAAESKPRELSWEDLMPPATQPPPPAFPGVAIAGQVRPEASPYSPMYSHNPVKSLDGKFVKLPGYIVPLESDAGGMLDEFLLVPYFGACIHVPPPPPNQVVYVRLKKPFNLKSMADPYWITGTISTKTWSGDVADTDYIMSGDKVEPFL